MKYSLDRIGSGSDQGYTPKATKQKFPWLDTALVIGAVALGTLAILCGKGVIHPSISLGQIGTLSTQAIEHMLTLGSAILLSAEGLHFLSKCLQIIQEEGPSVTLESSQLMEEEELYLETYPTDTCAIIDSTEEYAGTKTSVHYQLEGLQVAGKEASLFGIFPEGVSIETISPELAEIKEENKVDIEDKLTEICSKHGVTLSLQIGNNIYVAGTNFVVVDFEANKIQYADQKNIQFRAFTDSNKVPRDWILLGSPDVIKELATDQFEFFQKSLKKQDAPFHNANQVNQICRKKMVEDISIVLIYT